MERSSARHKPKALLRAKLVQPLLRALLPLCGEPRDDDLGGEDDDECDPNNEDEARSDSQWFPYDRVRVVNADP